MHLITCPKCKIKLRLEKPLANAKVRCKQCGTVFVGTSQPIEDQPEAKAARAVANVAGEARTSPTGRPVRDIPRAYHHAPKPKGSPWMIVVVIAAVFGIVIAAFAGYYLSTHPDVEIKDENGKIVYTGRMQIDEYNRRVAAIEEKKKKKKLAEATKSTDPAADNNTGDTSTSGEGMVVGEPRLLPKDPAPTTYKPLEDIDIPVIMNPSPIVAGPWRIDFVGDVHNGHDYPLASATITVSILNAEGTPIAAKTITVQHIPAKGRVPFSVDFKDLTASNVADAKGYATGEKAKDGVVCWELISSDCKKDSDKITQRKFVLTGSVFNRHDFDVGDTKIYVNFFDKDGRHLGMATGELEKRYIDNIPSGKKGYFRVDFKTDDPTIVEKWTVRVVGNVS